jgi:hypothetical protein
MRASLILKIRSTSHWNKGRGSIAPEATAGFDPILLNKNHCALKLYSTNIGLQRSFHHGSILRP